MLPAITWGTWDRQADHHMLAHLVRSEGEFDWEGEGGGEGRNRQNQSKIHQLQRNAKVQAPVFEKVLKRVLQAGVVPQYSTSTQSCVDVDLWWNDVAMCKPCHPAAGLLTPDRAHRKRQQVANMGHAFELVISQLQLQSCKSDLTIVEFCASSGYIALPLAFKFPSCKFVILDMKATSISIARQRVLQSGLTNVVIFHGLVQDWTEPFDVGIALHACGEVSDLVQELCIQKNASYVICPCCVGKVQNSKLSYPRSSRLSSLLTTQEFYALASAADFGHSAVAEGCAGGPDLDDPRYRNRRLCKALVELDRNMFAEENHVPYTTLLQLMTPRWCTPKNDMIVGWPSNKTQHQVDNNALDRLVEFLFSKIDFKALS